MYALRCTRAFIATAVLQLAQNLIHRQILLLSDLLTGLCEVDEHGRIVETCSNSTKKAMSQSGESMWKESH
jgi:hypothetical protein